jgi:hypothetical protein
MDGGKCLKTLSTFFVLHLHDARPARLSALRITNVTSGLILFGFAKETIPKRVVIT